MKQTLISALKGIAFWAIFMWCMAFVIEIVWNALVPSLFHGPTMNYQQAGSAYVLILVVASVFKMLDACWPT